MNIGILIKNINLFGGAEKVAINLSDYLSKNHNIYIISIFSEDNNNIYNLNENIRVIHLNIKEKISSLKNKGLRFISNQIINLFLKKKINKEIDKLLSNKKFDLLISNNVYGHIAKICNKNSKNIVIQHMSYEEVDKKFFKEDKYGFILYLFWKLRIRYRDKEYRKMDYIIVLSKLEKLKFEKKGFKNVKIIYNALNLFPNLEVNYKNKKMISIGRLSREKGFDRLINIVEDVFLRYKDWKLEIYGEGKEEEKIKKIIKVKKLENNIEIFKSIKNVFNKISDCSIFLVTSRQEGFSMVTIESMSVGVPVISYEFSATKEIIDNKVNGVIIDYDDEKSFKEELEILIQDSDLRKVYGEKAKEKSKKFSWKYIGKEWDDLIKEFEKES